VKFQKEEKKTFSLRPFEGFNQVLTLGSGHQNQKLNYIIELMLYFCIELRYFKMVD
jgi:hypothetical protein